MQDNNGMQSDGKNVFFRSDILPLFRFANRKVTAICNENRKLLLFPQSLDDTEDRIEDSEIIKITTTNDPDFLKIETNNILGFFGTEGLMVKISSRFDDGNNDYLLQYMLHKVFSFNLFDLNYNSSSEGVFDFLMFTFPYFIKGALRQGVYREYRRYPHNDARVNGAIDVSRHIKLNSPFLGTIAYTTREYSYDNSVTELIRHTIEYIKTKKYGGVILNHDAETVAAVKQICDCTPSYNESERPRLICQNLRPSVHPYYMDYYPLQSLCVQILRMEEVRFGDSEEELCGILFDGAWLWEEYVNTVLDGLGFTHAENKKGKKAIYLFEDHREDGTTIRSGRRFPDFYKSDFVLDAKYKRIGSLNKVSSVNPDDLHQVMSYMLGMNVQRGGFVAPLPNRQTKVPKSSLKDGKGTVSIFGIEISKANSYSDFCRDMARAEERFINTLDIQ